MSLNSRTDTLAMFAKQPRPGLVKSRLAADTFPEWAAEVATACLRDLLSRFATLAVRRVLVYDPPEALAWFTEFVADRFALVPQTFGDLGERLSAFAGDEFGRGAQRVVLIGMDSPTLPSAFVEQAFDDLQTHDVVLGPATDGGYYLIGCRRCEPRVFENVDWSGSRVLFDTVTRVRECKLRLALLPPWYDVDTLDDWWMLRGHVAALREAGVDPKVGHVERLF